MKKKFAQYLWLFLAMLALTQPSVAQVETPPTDTPEVAIADKNPVDSIITVCKEPECIQASFPGGEMALYNFLGTHVNYPADARNKGIQGRVVLSFVIELDGILSDIKVIRSVGGGCDEEAIRVLQLMPKWIPTQLSDGTKVRQRYTLPLHFKLANGNPNAMKKIRRGN